MYNLFIFSWIWIDGVEVAQCIIVNISCHYCTI